MRPKAAAFMQKSDQSGFAAAIAEVV